MNSESLSGDAYWDWFWARTEEDAHRNECLRVMRREPEDIDLDFLYEWALSKGLDTPAKEIDEDRVRMMKVYDDAGLSFMYPRRNTS